MTNGDAVEARWKSVSAVVSFINAVASDRPFAAVEVRGVNWVIGTLAPVPVWLGSLETTFVLKSLLEHVSEVSMPWQEAGGSVDGQSLVDMCPDKVTGPSQLIFIMSRQGNLLIASLGTWNHSLIGNTW